MIQSSSFQLLHSTAHPLCPSCGGSSIRITTAVLVHYDIIYDAAVHDFAVIDELIGDAMWDGHSEASCTVCEWIGTVDQLREFRRNDPG